MQEAVIVEAVRTPVGRRGGALAQWHPVDLLGRTLAELLDRAGIDDSLIDDVITGVAMQHEHQSGNLGRHAVLSAGLAETIPAVTIDRQCGSGQQAVNFAAQAIMAGAADVVVACGVESMSQTPLLQSFAPGAPLGPQYSPVELARYDGNMVAQGAASEILNSEFGFTRVEIDDYAARSHARAHAATEAGKFADQMVPIRRDPFDPESETVTADEGIRAVFDREKVAAMKPVFTPDGSTTAANASQISDGAAALLLTSAEFAKAHGLRARARLRAMSVAADDPITQFTAVLSAARKALETAGLTIDDIDLVEVNEAFAAVPLLVQREFGIPDEKLNVNGGSIAIGHPLGSTGARMLTDLLCELERTGGKYGIQIICEATGTSNATIIERLAAA